MKSKTFIIAEAGSNWKVGSPERDWEMAKSLIDVASNAKTDAIKFQTYRAETVYVPNAGGPDYLKKKGTKNSINKIFEELSMPYEFIPKLARYCNQKRIKFMSTPFSVKDAKAIDPFVEIHKIASYEITHSRLIEFIASTGKPLILSTGAATIFEIEWAVDFFKRKGGKKISLMQTTAKYPAPVSSLNLNTIPWLKKKFNLSVGLSDHSRDPVIAPVAAVALGADLIEKHFTLHNQLPGPDHFFALTPNELKTMVKSIRECEMVLGKSKKNVQESEKELRRYAQRGIQAIKSIKKGDRFKEGKNIDILRPGKRLKGLHPRFLDEIEGKKATRNISLGDGILREDFE